MYKTPTKKFSESTNNKQTFVSQKTIVLRKPCYKNAHPNASYQRHSNTKQSSLDSQLSETSDYLTDDSINKTNSFLENDISMDASSPLNFDHENPKIIQTPLQRKKANTKAISTKTNPSILINDKNLTDNTFAGKQDYINHSPYDEENKRLKKKIEQMELHKQINNKDKVMSQLLEISQSEGFPKLKHLCHAECVRDKKGMCKKIKQQLKNEQCTGVMNYVWNTIAYPMSAVHKGMVKAVYGTGDKQSETKNCTKEKNQKQTSANPNEIDKEKPKSYSLTDYIWGGGQKGDANSKECTTPISVKKNKNKSFRITNYVWGVQKEDEAHELKELVSGNSKKRNALNDSESMEEAFAQIEKMNHQK